ILNRSSVPGGTAPAPAPVPAPPITTPGTPTAPPAGGTPTAPPAGGTPTPTPTPTPAPGGPTVGAIVGVTAAPTQVNPGDTFKIEWSVAGVQNVTHTNVHLDIVTHTSVEWQTGIGRFFGPVRTGTNGNYDNSFVAPPSAGTFYYVVHVQADGKDTYTSEATVTVGQPSSGGPTPPGGGSTPAAQPTTTVTGFPATVAPGASFDIAWEIADPNGAALSVAHSNIHFDVVSHTAAEWSNLAGQFGPIQSGAAGKYKNTLVAPAQPGKVFFVVHSVINGTDLYTSQQEIEVK
ncbi:MAG: hypothetical protein HY722_04435, partial [Planctomycetes bacterium]|nr:hypothetical protein [Planctomycetota bacterium]